MGTGIVSHRGNCTVAFNQIADYSVNPNTPTLTAPIVVVAAANSDELYFESYDTANDNGTENPTFKDNPGNTSKSTIDFYLRPLKGAVTGLLVFFVGNLLVTSLSINAAEQSWATLAQLRQLKFFPLNFAV